MLLNLYCKALRRTGQLSHTKKHTITIIFSTTEDNVYQWTLTGHGTPGPPGEQWGLVTCNSTHM